MRDIMFPVRLFPAKALMRTWTKGRGLVRRSELKARHVRKNILERETPTHHPISCDVDKTVQASIRDLAPWAVHVSPTVCYCLQDRQASLVLGHLSHCEEVQERSVLEVRKREWNLHQTNLRAYYWVVHQSTAPMSPREAAVRMPAPGGGRILWNASSKQYIQQLVRFFSICEGCGRAGVDSEYTIIMFPEAFPHLQ